MAKSKKESVRFSDIQLKNLKPVPGKRYVKMEPGGLAVRVGTNISFMFRYQYEGRDRWMNLGIYPAMSLSEARAAKEQQNLLLKQGVDPGQKQQEEKLEYKKAPTITNLISEYWDTRLSKLKSGSATRRLLEKDLIKKWGKRKVGSIKTRDIVLLLDQVEERAPVTRNRLHTAINGLFAFAVSRGIIDISPCANINRVDEETRDRVLSDSEVQRLWKCLDTDNKDILDIYPITKLALKLILLTGQRPGEVTGMTSREVVKREDGTWWEIPAERMKGRKAKEHDVPLSPVAIDVIEQAKVYSGKSEYVFRTSFKKDGPLTVRALSRAVVRHLDKMKIDKFTPHDLRRTCRTGLAKLKVSDVVAEKILSHQLQGVLGVYNRSGYDMERRAALSLWENYILGLVTESPTESNGNIADLNSYRARRKHRV